MGFGTALQVISVLTGVIGIVMAFIPAFVLRPFGMRLDPTAAFSARLFGAALGFAALDAAFIGAISSQGWPA
jgi:hypothetical protein